MIRRSFFMGLLLMAVGLMPWGVGAADDNGFLPPAHDLFRPLQADPRELQYTLRTVTRVGKDPLGEAAIGDYLGVYRWGLPWEGSAFQISFGGGVFGRFDLAQKSNSLIVADYYGNIPFDFKFNTWAIRFMAYHTSSHLGDDYLARNGGTTTKHAFDNLSWTTSWDAHHYLRLYGGYTYVFRTLPHDLDRNALQAGFETQSPRWSKGCAHVYWANDFQSWGRAGWNPMFNSQLGVKFSKSAENPRGVSVFTELMTGHMPQGQFYDREETSWNFGVKFDLS
jgi:hypothetical protein